MPPRCLEFHFFFLYLKFIVHKNDQCCDVRFYWCFLANYPFLNRFHHAILENWKSNKAFIDNYKWKRFLKLKIAYRHVPYFRIKSDLVQCTHVYSMYLQVNKNVPTYNVIFFLIFTDMLFASRYLFISINIARPTNSVNSVNLACLCFASISTCRYVLKGLKVIFYYIFY